MSDSDTQEPRDTMRGRIDQNRWKLWVLMNANRWLVAGLVLALVFVALVLCGVLDAIPLRTSMHQSDPIQTLFQAMLTAIITGVSLVVSINQLVLSQELGAVGDQRERMEEALQFRADVEALLDAPVSPPEPSAFLRALVDHIHTQADRLCETAAAHEDDAFQENVADYTESLAGNARQVCDQLDDAQFGTFSVVFAALNFNYSWKIYLARRLRNAHAAALSDETEAAFDALLDALELFGPAREHIKTLYFQWEFIDLSRALLYAAVPALAVAATMILYLDNPASLPGTMLGVDNLIWVTAVAAAITLLPFMLLLSFVLRIVTVAKRTLAIGPFVLRRSERTDDINW